MENTRGYACDSRSPDTDTEDVGGGSKNADDRVNRDRNDLPQTGQRIATTDGGGGVGGDGGGGGGGGRWCTSGVLSRSSTSFLIHNLLISCADRAPPRRAPVSPAATSSAPTTPPPMAHHHRRHHHHHRHHRRRRHHHQLRADNDDNNREWTDDEDEDDDDDDDNSSSISADTRESVSCSSPRTTAVARSQPSENGQVRGDDDDEDEDDDDDDEDDRYGNIYGRTVKRRKHAVPSRRRAAATAGTKDEADASAVGSCTDDENGESKTESLLKLSFFFDFLYVRVVSTSFSAQVMSTISSLLLLMHL